MIITVVFIIENAIPLSEYLRRKRGLPPKNPEVFSKSINTTLNNLKR